MRQIYLLILCLFTFGILSAQEENLSKEEKARREKNIQAGNPFAKYGYKAKVATLSKGKYLEVYDLDSIVTIGTIRWNVNQNKIVGHIVQDTTDMYAQPIGDTAGRWLSPDPLSDEFPEWSPYVSTNDNPIFFVDPEGMAAMAPIYGTDGSFLGTDDQGLQGKGIVMEKSDFTQGMSHEDALSKSLGAEGLESKAAESKVIEHYSDLKDRPDYNGVVTLGEANDWARNGNGQPLFVDVGKLDLSSVSVWGNFAEYDSSTRSYFSMDKLTEDNYKWKSTVYVNFLSPAGTPGDISSSNHPGLVFGTLAITLLDRNTGDVRLGNSSGRLDVYNFEQQKGRTFRNTLTWFGKQLATQGGTSTIKDYSIYGYGKAQVSNGF